MTILFADITEIKFNRIIYTMEITIQIKYYHAFIWVRDKTFDVIIDNV